MKHSRPPVFCKKWVGPLVCSATLISIFSAAVLMYAGEGYAQESGKEDSQNQEKSSGGFGNLFGGVVKAIKSTTKEVGKVVDKTVKDTPVDDAYQKGKSWVKGTEGDDLPELKPQSPQYNEQVKFAQKSLNDLGYDAGPADGLMGNKTISAIKAFEKDNGLTITGKVNKGMLSKLSAAKASSSGDNSFASAEPVGHSTGCKISGKAKVVPLAEHGFAKEVKPGKYYVAKHQSRTLLKGDIIDVQEVMLNSDRPYSIRDAIILCKNGMIAGVAPRGMGFNGSNPMYVPLDEASEATSDGETASVPTRAEVENYTATRWQNRCSKDDRLNNILDCQCAVNTLREKMSELSDKELMGHNFDRLDPLVSEKLHKVAINECGDRDKTYNFIYQSCLAGNNNRFATGHDTAGQSAYCDCAANDFANRVKEYAPERSSKLYGYGTAAKSACRHLLVDKPNPKPEKPNLDENEQEDLARLDGLIQKHLPTWQSACAKPEFSSLVSCECVISRFEQNVRNEYAGAIEVYKLSLSHSPGALQEKKEAWFGRLDSTRGWPYWDAALNHCANDAPMEQLVFERCMSDDINVKRPGNDAYCRCGAKEFKRIFVETAKTSSSTKNVKQITKSAFRFCS